MMFLLRFGIIRNKNIMKRNKIKDGKGIELISSNAYEDDDCPVCRLMRSCELEERDPSLEELERAMEAAQ